RYFRPIPGVSITGIDIDADNIAWCAQNLRFGRFLHTPLYPPSALPSQSFDLLIGVSVFTHLSEETQLAWLAELQRLAARNAVWVMTVHGRAAGARAGGHDLSDRLQRLKFIDGGPVRALDEVIAQPDYYRSSFHARDHVREQWGKYFQIIEIVPGYIGHQDLVILRNE